MKVLTIIKNDRITGVEYGMVELPDKNVRNMNKTESVQRYTQATIRNRMKTITERQKHK